MLKNLFIKDYVLIDSLNIQFENGLNVITGETGAGKSIIIDAMNLLIGERASTDLIRKGSDKAIIEGIFDVTENQKIKSYFLKNELDFADELIVRREINIKGNSRCFINDSPVTLSELKEIGKLIIDLHGQHEHQTLLRVETHIDLLDNFGSLTQLLDEYQKYYYELNSVFKQIAELKIQEKQIKERKEFYDFQLKEINSVDPKDDELDNLISKIRILENSEKLFEYTNRIYQTYYGSSSSVYDQLNKIKILLDELAKIDPIFEDIYKENNTIISIVNDLAKSVQSYNSKIDFSLETLDSMRERLGKLNSLVKKYGGSLENVLNYKTKIEKEISLVDNFEIEIDKLNLKAQELIKKCSELAEELSGKRKKIAKELSVLIVSELKELGIEHAKFEVNFSSDFANGDDIFIQSGNKKLKAHPKGYDLVEFFISTNAGENPKPLVKVASGGEISRIMLALKSILAKTDKLPLMVFDEIDVGISGRIAQKVGSAMKNLAKNHQIITITHLPQIASFGNSHFVVQKFHKNNNTFSIMKKLTEEERITEIAKLLSGEVVTETSLKTAAELLETGKKL